MAEIQHDDGAGGASPAPRVPGAVPDRFTTAPATLRIDRFMSVAIRVGGVAIIFAVFGILLFIVWQTLPLFGGASVGEKSVSPAVAAPPAGAEGAIPAQLGIDEWAAMPFVYRGGGEISFFDLRGDRGEIRLPLGLPDGSAVTAANFYPARRQLALGLSDGQATIATISYQQEFENGTAAGIVPSVEIGDLYQVGVAGVPVAQIGYGDSGSDKLLVSAQIPPGGGKPVVRAVTLAQKRSLLGAGKIEVGDEFDLSDLAPPHLGALLVPSMADSILLADSGGEVRYLVRDGDAGFALRQTFQPFADLGDTSVAQARYLLGDVSVSFVARSGEHRIFSLFRPGEKGDRIFGQTKEFPALPGPATAFAPSLRNKAILVTAGSFATLRYVTTEAVRWGQELPFAPVACAIDGKFEHLVFLDEAGSIHLFDLDDPHPEAGLHAFFGKVWYEGASEPAYVWQSTGGSDEFEPKLSMMPLIFGSLKGTAYALVFAVPIALLAAVYTAQFLHPPVKRIVKPAMEIMASLPSVVLGFLAALWLAPLIETMVPSVLLVCAGLPLLAAAAGFAWGRLPARHRSRIKPGFEFVALAPVVALGAWALWSLGPAFERAFFAVTDPATGQRIADFRLWWPEKLGIAFEQRNSLVVGFMMGFAVIPVIFTIAEDALSNVPPSLTAASAALGASRWQVVRTIAIPVASAGIFSALMIGFGRAVGETMIVVMATGNTPIMDWDIFTGMRTLSANIAVELPEAPVHSTHYRTLFLGAVILFALTFTLNSVAEVLRQHLREKFKLV